MKAKSLDLRQIFATNSQKTIEVELETSKGKVRSSVPVGTSTGKYEVKYLPVDDVIKKFPTIKRFFTANEFDSQGDVDSTLKIIDKTEDFSGIGGNTALAVSSAFLKAFALEEGKEVFEYLSKEKPKIPIPLCNVIGGWKGQSDIQEYFLFPVHQTSFFNSISKISQVYIELGNELKENDTSFKFGKNLESAWVTGLSIESILKILTNIADKNLLKIGIDLAASQLWNGHHYVYSNGEKLNMPAQVDFVDDLVKRFPINYVEDPFHEDDYLAHRILTGRLREKIIAGDDLYASNAKRLEEGIFQKSTNAIILKPNQVGTISNLMKTVELAKKNKIITIMSHRSGETEDTLICHLAVGLNCDYIKLGISGERIIKINEMIRIEESLKE